MLNGCFLDLIPSMYVQRSDGRKQNKVAITERAGGAH